MDPDDQRANGGGIANGFIYVGLIRGLPSSLYDFRTIRNIFMNNNRRENDLFEFYQSFLPVR